MNKYLRYLQRNHGEQMKTAYDVIFGSTIALACLYAAVAALSGAVPAYLIMAGLLLIWSVGFGAARIAHNMGQAPRAWKWYDYVLRKYGIYATPLSALNQRLEGKNEAWKHPNFDLLFLHSPLRDYEVPAYQIDFDPHYYKQAELTETELETCWDVYTTNVEAQRLLLAHYTYIAHKDVARHLFQLDSNNCLPEYKNPLFVYYFVGHLSGALSAENKHRIWAMYNAQVPYSVVEIILTEPEGYLDELMQYPTDYRNKLFEVLSRV